MGRRVQRVVGKGKENTKFIYDGDDVLADDDGGDLTKYQNGLGIDNKLRVQTGTDVKYFLADHLGSTNGLADATGAITASTAYDAFGNPTNANFPSRYQYTGREYDTVSGFYYYRARYYDPSIGRFMSEDPIGFAGGDVNFYGYVRNQPVWFRDPKGLMPGNDVASQPGVLQALGTAAAAVGTALGAAASSPVVVAGAGLGAGVAIGYYPGQWTASHPSNPFVNGPLNPFGTPFPGVRPLPPAITSISTAKPYCQSGPTAIPFYRTPSIPWPTMPPDRDGCAQEWADAYEWCAMNTGKPDLKGMTGGYKSLYDCARGLVSRRCGGNAY